MKRLLCLLILLLLPGCNNAPESLARFHGKTESFLIAEMGASTYTNYVRLKQGEMLPELYVAVHNTYHPDDPATDGIEIKELRWDRDGYTLAAFFHKVDGEWVVLETGGWRDGVAF